jgi:hypothetical protein
MEQDDLTPAENRSKKPLEKRVRKWHRPGTRRVSTYCFNNQPYLEAIPPKSGHPMFLRSCGGNRSGIRFGNLFRRICYVF